MDEDPGLKLAFSEIKLQGEGGYSSREFGTYQGTHVMIEWKILSPDLPQNQSLCRMRDLARFLSKDNASKDRNLSHLPECLGYCRKSLPGQVDRVALIYETSKAAHRTLNELLTDTANEYFSLGTRLRFALSLAECIFFLHVTGWLHKSIRSSNIIISGDKINFKNETVTKALKLQLAGFGAARLDGVGEISEKVEEARTDDLYQHPDYQSSNKDETRYTRQYDIYSLGLVLLELGIWETIKDKGIYNPKKHNPKRFLDRLLIKGPVDSLSFTMGNSYKRAVVWCLQGQFGKDDNASLTDSENSMIFWDKVVMELTKCSVEE